MRKLHIRTDAGKWEPVFCQMNGKVITCDDVRKALPPKAIWAEDDLAYFQNKFGNSEFTLLEVRHA